MTTVQEHNCIFCEERFDDKETLQVHFRKHGDPNFNQSKTKARSQYVAQTSDEKSKDVTEMVGCDVCTEVFPTISKAITHKHKVHPDHDSKYFCPWCGKLFTMKHLYNKHLQASHDSMVKSDELPFRCDCCEVDFYVPTAMLYHNKFFHRQDTDIPAFGHSKKLKMQNQEVLQIYYCSFCGEEYVNKVNLHKHILDDHSDENQSPDEVLRCPLCDAIFYHLDAYDVHLTFHSVEDLYSEKNELMNNITEFSLEAVPPSTEKVENCEPQQDAETTMTDMSFVDILQLAADQSNEQLSKKSKKHKKHKKSKKSAITLDEFLNMNKDVFGEGLDFQGVEEVPTRVVAKHLKVNKKALNSNSKTTPELDKLRKQGIIIKKKSGSEITAKPLKITANTLVDKTTCNATAESKLSSSSDVLSKLISQSNNQIQIVKKGSKDKNVSFCEIISKETNVEKPSAVVENENMECDSTKKELGETTTMESNSSRKVDEHRRYNFSLDISDFSEKNASQESQDILTSKSKCPSPLVNSNNDTKLIDFVNDDELCTNKNNYVNNENCGPITTENTAKPENVSDSRSDLANTIQTAVDIYHNKLENDCNIRDETDIKLSTESEEFYKEIDSKTKSEKENGNSSSESLSALKHLRHLITVKTVTPTKLAMEENDDADNKNAVTKNFEEIENKSIENFVTSTNSYKDINNDSQISETSLDTLKSLGKNIAFKCVSHKHNDFKAKSTDFNNTDFDDDDEYEKDSIDTNNSQHSIKAICCSTTESTNAVTTADILKRPHPAAKGVSYSEEIPSKKEIMNKYDNDTKKNSSHLLKHLTNITAKPLNIAKTVNKITPIISSSSRNIVNKNISRTIQRVELNQDDIEILNIDDSDSDDMDNINDKTDCKTSLSSMDPLQNLNKNILVKSLNTQKLESNKTVVNKNPVKEIPRDESQANEPITSINQNHNALNSANTPYASQKSINDKFFSLKHALKTLGKNITVKSRNSSPNHTVKYQELYSENNDIGDNEGDSDIDSCSGRIKITEICEDYHSDEEMKRIQSNDNAIVQTPDDSCSETETQVNEDIDDQESDFEKQIKLNTVKKPDQNIQSFKSSSLSGFKNISKDITIKSLKDNPDRVEIANPNQNSDIVQNLTSHKSIKPMLQHKKDQQDNHSTSISGQARGQKLSQTSVNQKMAASSNQINTVNKEVTVKTFQTETKTVIQEITTTVTKTIKTVNQTMKEEVRNACQSTSTPVMPQKIQGIRVNQQPKNLQGITVRHATQSGIGPKIRNSTPFRPIGSSMVRPSNQLVPVSFSTRLPNQIRPGTNVARLSTPRMPVQQTIRLPIANKQCPKVARPLKVSPSAIISPANKRHNSEELCGPFSCFKRSKESLIPGSEIPIFSNSNESQTEYSTMQMSKSNFMSTTKTVKGNSVVTSSQMKSEINASSQQLSKLSNMSGLRVVKTSQSKQVQETSENSGMKRTTLEAIEKLQKQGLLVKKPRLDQSDESEHSDAGGDHVDYS